MKQPKQQPKPKSHLLFMNGYLVKAQAPSEVLSAILSAPELMYWSHDALKKFYVGAVEMVVKFCMAVREEAKGADKTRLTRFPTVGASLIRHIPSTRGAMLKKIFDTILTGDRLGLLAGYGFTNTFGDKISGSPEYTSIYRGYTGLKEG